jgi:hypothetical protein
MVEQDRRSFLCESQENSEHSTTFWEHVVILCLVNHEDQVVHFQIHPTGLRANVLIFASINVFVLGLAS